LKIIYTINGFSELLTTSSQYKKESTKGKKLLLLDRCNWLITRIISINLHYNEPIENYVNLHSSHLKRFLTNRNYKGIQDCLYGLGIIQKNGTYSTDRFSKSFKLTAKAIDLGIIETTILTDKFNRQYERINDQLIEKTLSNPLLKKIAINTAKLKVVENESFLQEAYYNPLEHIKKDKFEAMSDEECEGFLNELELKFSKDKDYLFKVMRYKEYYRGFKSLNSIDDPLQVLKLYVNYIPSIANTGRVYHTFASMPRQVRKCLKTKSNELIWEVDMSSAQPSIIFLEWLKWAKNNYSNKFKDEYELCLKLLLDGGIYKYIESNSEYFNDLSYEKLKKSILSAINAENKPTTPPKKELSRLFPNVMMWVNAIKKKSGYKEVSFLGQSAEANIFVEVYKEIPDEKFALIIHDCILTTKKDVLLVKKLLEDRVRKLFSDVILENHNLDKLFKTSLVSIRDEELMENKLNKFYDKIKEPKIKIE